MPASVVVRVLFALVVSFAGISGFVVAGVESASATTPVKVTCNHLQYGPDGSDSLAGCTKNSITGGAGSFTQAPSGSSFTEP